MSAEPLDERARRYAEIEALMASQDWDQAIARCIQLLASDPLDEKVDTLLARCRQEMRARQQQEAQTTALLVQAQSALRAGRYAEGGSLATRALALAPGTVEAQALAAQARLGQLLIESQAAIDRGHFDEALRLTERVLAQSPARAEAMQEREPARADKAARAPQPPEAGQEMMTPVPQAQPPLPRAPQQGSATGGMRTIRLPRPNHISEGSLQARTREREEADRTERDEARKAETVRRLYAQARVAMDHRHSADAIVDLEALLAIAPDHSDAQELLGRAKDELRASGELSPLLPDTRPKFQDLRHALHSQPTMWQRVGRVIKRRGPFFVLTLVLAVLLVIAAMVLSRCGAPAM